MRPQQDGGDTMVTDDERRLVAERLHMSDERDAAGFDCLLAEVVRGREFCETPCEECRARLLGELADLIDPGDTSQGCRDTVACDREALLALADEMDERAPYGWYSGERDSLREYASRIREALGVEL